MNINTLHIKNSFNNIYLLSESNNIIDMNDDYNGLRIYARELFF